MPAAPAQRPDVIVVGAGLAGLSAAVHLTRAQRRVVVLEASDGVGGRVRTDEVDGHLLDRGFQVLLTGYPETRRQLDYRRLDLQRFAPGVQVFADGRMRTVADPLQAPMQAPATLASGIATPGDLVGLLKLRAELSRASGQDIATAENITAREYLRDLGFSQRIVDRFFAPFLAGIFFDPDLATSSRMVRLILRTFFRGEVAVPAPGMGAIPQQLADLLAPGSVHLEHPVLAVHPGAVELADGSVWRRPTSWSRRTRRSPRPCSARTGWSPRPDAGPRPCGSRSTARARSMGRGWRSAPIPARSSRSRRCPGCPGRTGRTGVSWWL